MLFFFFLLDFRAGGGVYGVDKEEVKRERKNKKFVNFIISYYYDL